MEPNRRSVPNDPHMISRADVDWPEAVDLALYVARWMKDYHRGTTLDKGDELTLLQVREMALTAVGMLETKDWSHVEGLASDGAPL